MRSTNDMMWHIIKVISGLLELSSAAPADPRAGRYAVDVSGAGLLTQGAWGPTGPLGTPSRTHWALSR
jgi:hypothetical protein